MPFRKTNILSNLVKYLSIDMKSDMKKEKTSKVPKFYYSKKTQLTIFHNKTLLWISFILANRIFKGTILNTSQLSQKFQRLIVHTNVQQKLENFTVNIYCRYCGKRAVFLNLFRRMKFE